MNTLVMRPSDTAHLRAAVEILRRRAAAPGGYRGLSAAAAHGLCRTLEGVADGAPEADLVDRGEVICLAHRLIDDDHPQLSPLWPTDGDDVLQP